ncbi:tetratricopeptide repeat protein [Flavitalea antarctica]
MSQSLEHIENYFQGTLNAVEAREFEKAIQNDPDFAKEVAFYMSSVATVKDQLNTEKKARFRQVYDSSKMVVADHLAPADSKGAIVRKIWKYAVAAAVFSAVLVSGYLYTKNPSPQQMADKFISEEFQTLGVTMGTTADSMTMARQLNDKGKYAEALAIFENLAKQYPTDVKAREYAGIAALMMKEYDKALQYFQNLSSVQGLKSNPGNFYTAVTLMKRNQPGDNDKAKKILQNVVKNKETHSEIAEAWLSNW